QLALVETLAIGCHAVARGNPQRGDHVLVIGAGPIGLATIEFVKLAGAIITVLDVNERRLDFCKQTMGVAHVVRADADGSHAIQLQDISEGRWYPVVFEATGNDQSMSNALNYVAHTGKLVFVGI